MEAMQVQGEDSQAEADELVPASSYLTLTADIVSAYVSHNRVVAGDLAGLISSVHASLISQDALVKPKAQQLTPAVPIKSSVHPDYIVCLEDGKKVKLLKRYLRARFNMSPDQYRQRWGLPANYPMTAPNYSVRRTELALSSGLGRRPRSGS